MVPESGWMCRLTRNYEARCGWTTVAVDSQLGYSGYPAHPPECTRPAEAPFIAGLAAPRFVRSAGRAEHGGMADHSDPNPRIAR